MGSKTQRRSLWRLARYVRTNATAGRARPTRPLPLGQHQSGSGRNSSAAFPRGSRAHLVWQQSARTTRGCLRRTTSCRTAPRGSNSRAADAQAAPRANVRRLKERKRKAEQDRLKKTTSKNWKPAKRNRFLTNIYGKGLDGLSTASIVRRDAHIQNALQFPEETSMFGEPTVPVKGGAYASWNAMAPCKQLAPPSMQFRDEYPEKELGGRFGVSRYIARSYFGRRSKGL